MNERPESRFSLEQAAEALYSSELPYHNFQHAQWAREQGKAIIDGCKREGILIKEAVVDLALLFHDAGYNENHKENGFETKEAYSAHLAGEALRHAGYESDLIRDVQDVIISTHRDASFVTNEAKVVRAADLAGIAGDYETFLENNRRLKKEAETLLGVKIERDEWKRKTEEIIGFYLQQDIRLTSAHEDEGGESIFHMKARENLKRFLQEEGALDA